MTVSEFTTLAGQLGIAPGALAGAVQTGGVEALASFGAEGASLIGAEGAAAVGGQFAAIVGWALPIAAAVAIGGMILRAALSRRGSFGESKDRARAAIARLGMPQAYQVANSVLDSLLATNRPPASFTQEVAIQTGYVFAVWYENVDSFHDVFQGTPGGLELHERLLAKAHAYYDRVDAMRSWWAQVLRFVQQADQSWGQTAGAQAYLEEVGRQVPPPAWLRGWQDFLDLAALGYDRLLAEIRRQIQWETVGRWETGNA